MAGYISDLLPHLPSRHRAALRWFEMHAGKVVGWPEPLTDGTRLVSKAKAIFKPEWSEFALSIRQNLNSPYTDREVEQNSDGSWSYVYSLEGLDPESAGSLFTNRGMIACFEQLVPVGVMIQQTPKPNTTYLVLGLGFVNGYDTGHFFLQSVQGASRYSVADTSPPLPEKPDFADQLAGAFDPAMVADARRRTLAVLTQRQGQGGFRRSLLSAYHSQCAVTGYDSVESLEAAHIIAYRGPVTNHVSNGLLLRADIHSLFDLGLLGLQGPRNALSVVLAPELRGTRYAELEHRPVSVPDRPSSHPSLEALFEHRRLAGL